MAPNSGWKGSRGWKSIGAVLHLHQHVVGELAVERHEFVVRLLGAVVGRLVRVDEGAPHHDAAMRRQRFGQHVGAVGMVAPVILRSGLAFGIRLDEETAEIGNVAVDLVDLRLPPGAHRGIERIRGLESAEFDGRAEPRGEIHAHAVGTEHVGQRRGLVEICRREAGGIGIHVGEHRAVDADRRTGARVVGVARIEPARQLVPVPDRLARVAALDMPIEIVPVIQHANPRCAAATRCRAPSSVLPGLDQPQEMERAVQHADVGVRGDDRGGLPLTLTLRIT